MSKFITSKVVKKWLENLVEGNEVGDEALSYLFASLCIFEQAFSNVSEENSALVCVLHAAGAIHSITHFLSESEDIMSDELLNRMEELFSQCLATLLDKFDLKKFESFVGVDKLTAEMKNYMEGLSEFVARRQDKESKEGRA